MSSELIRQRADLINTQVITIDSAKSLGVVKEVLVDIDSREVVALGLRDNIVAVPGNLARYMLLSSIRKLGDSILVDTDDVIEDIDPEAYTSLVNCEVITETGDVLGKVRGFKFSCEDGRLTSIIIAALGLPLIPDQVISTYELSIDEVVSSGPNRLIVIEGTEERLDQLSVGFLERIGLGKAPWEDEYGDYRPTIIRPENQLPAGMPVAPPPPMRPLRMPEPISLQERSANEETTWEEDDWQEPLAAPPPQKLRAEVVPYEDEEDNWSDTSRDSRRDSRAERPRRSSPPPQPPRRLSYREAAPTPEPEDEDIIDVWADQPAKIIDVPVVSDQPKPDRQQATAIDPPEELS
jgi:sporulation protein YlmC with PRC-barrel domain